MLTGMPLFAVVDIETTGGHIATSSITEIAIRIHDGLKLIEQFDSLIRPYHAIPDHIVALTGISNKMVEEAPTFDFLAKKIHHLLDGKIVVAHNVNFDYSLLKRQLQECGYNWTANRLCTLRLCRKYIPGMPSYSLSKLCDQLGIKMNSKHRASADVDATVTLFEKILLLDTKKELIKSISATRTEQLLPPNLNWGEYEKLPTTSGVYYFKDKEGKVIYIGKAKSIKRGVKQHFSGSNFDKKRKALLKEIHHIDAHPCANELMALILEATETRKQRPEANKAIKKDNRRYDLVSYEDIRGYFRLAINKHQRNQRAIRSFSQLTFAHNFLNKLVQEYSLCPKLCMLYKKAALCRHVQQSSCFGACNGDEHPSIYNQRIETAINAVLKSRLNYAYMDEGLTDNEMSCVLIENGSLYGMGYIPKQEYDYSYRYIIRQKIKRYPSTDHIMQIIERYIERYPEKVMLL